MNFVVINTLKKYERAGLGMLCVLLLAPAAWLAYGLDDWLGVSMSPWFWVFFLSYGGAVGVPAAAAGKSKWLLAPTVLYGAFLISLAAVDLSPTKPAVRAMAEIKCGMSEQQVLSILETQFPRDGRFKRPAFGPAQKNSISFALDPDDGRYNASIVTIEFKNGVCVRSDFMPD